MNLNFILTNNIPKRLSLWMKCRAGWDRRTTRSSCLHVFKHVTVRSLSNNDGDGNENGKKAIDLDWQNNNFGRSLCSRRFRASSSRTLGRERKKEEWRGRGRGEKVFSSPLPLPFPFFCSRFNFRAITRLETLATPATLGVHHAFFVHVFAIVARLRRETV